MELNEEVVSAAAAGDRDAVATVYRSLAPKVLGYLRSRGADDPEGLTGDVFQAVLPRLPALTGGAAGLRTLVFSVAHARYVDDVRRRARRPVGVPYEAGNDDRMEPSAETAALERTGAADAMSLLQMLGEDQRNVIGLRVLGDLSLEQTAEVLGKSIGAVKQLQRRGLEKLRDIVQEEGGGDE